MNFLLKLIPNDYKWSVAIKKVSWTLGKTAVALVAGTKLGKEISPDNWVVVTEVATTLLAGGMKLVHDWAKVKYPNTPWL